MPSLRELELEIEELEAEHRQALRWARDANYRLHEVGIAEETKKKLEETKKKLGIIKEVTCGVGCVHQGGRKKTRRRKKSKHSKTARRGRSKTARRGRSKTVKHGKTTKRDKKAKRRGTKKRK